MLGEDEQALNASRILDISHCNECGLFPAKAMRHANPLTCQPSREVSRTGTDWVAGTFSDITAIISLMSLPARSAGVYALHARRARVRSQSFPHYLKGWSFDEPPCQLVVNRLQNLLGGSRRDTMSHLNVICPAFRRQTRTADLREARLVGDSITHENVVVQFVSHGAVTGFEGSLTRRKCTSFRRSRCRHCLHNCLAGRSLCESFVPGSGNKLHPTSMLASRYIFERDYSSKTPVLRYGLSKYQDLGCRPWRRLGRKPASVWGQDRTRPLSR